MLTLQKRCFLHAMSQERDASIQQLAPLRGTAPKELLAQLTCSEFMQLVEQLKNRRIADNAAVD